jgi:hypothetical protein
MALKPAKENKKRPKSSIVRPQEKEIITNKGSAGKLNRSINGLAKLNLSQVAPPKMISHAVSSKKRK